MNNKVQTVAVLGATGKLGNHFVNKALDAGYNLKALVRNRSKFTHSENPSVKVIVGDATKPGDVESTISDTDVVVSCLGGTSKKIQIMEDCYDNIMNSAAQQSQPPRCIMISSIGLGGSSWFVKFLLTLIGGKAGIEDFEKADKRVREDAKVPFVLVRPYALTDKPGIGAYKILPGKDGTFAMSITRSDVAKFLVECVSNKSWDNKPGVLLGGAKKK